MSRVRVYPSLLAADAGRLEDELARVAEAGADGVHIDVMDGNFVPNIAFGPAAVAQLRRASSLPFDVHLMMLRTEDFVERYAEAGADAITIHVEAVPHPIRLLGLVRGLVGRAGVALNPATPVEAVRHLLPHADQVLVMSVDPGYSFQPFLEQSVEKVRELRRLGGAEIDVGVDGGVTPGRIAERLLEAGATYLVSGAGTFGSADLRSAIRELREAGGPPAGRYDPEKRRPRS